MNPWEYMQRVSHTDGATQKRTTPNQQTGELGKLGLTHHSKSCPKFLSFKSIEKQVHLTGFDGN